MPSIAEKLVEAEKNWQQFIAQAAYWQGRVETYREMLSEPVFHSLHAEPPSVGTNGVAETDPLA